MMLKLMKYEIKSTYKIFFTIIASFVLLTVLLCMSMNNPNALMMTILGLACFVIGGSTFCVYFVTLFNRYYKNLYGREGYLMLTLPVKGWELVCSKFVIALFWSVVLGIAVGICFLGVSLFIWSGVNHIVKQDYTLFQFYAKVLFENGHWYLVYQIVLCILVGIAQTIARIYFVISVAYLPFIKRAHIPIALFLYFVIDVVENFITSNIMRVVFHYYYSGGFYSELLSAFSLMETNASGVESVKFYTIQLLAILLTALLLAGSSYIISKKVSIK